MRSVVSLPAVRAHDVVDLPSTTTSLMPFFLVLRFLLRSFSSRSLGRTSGRTLSMTLGSTGFRGFSSQGCASAGLSR